MKHRISPATVIACVALFFSLAGTGIAAQHYLITSVSQIAPKVRHELRDRPTAPRLGIKIVYSTPYLYQPDDTYNTTVSCPSGYRAVSGGVWEGELTTVATQPVDDDRAWEIAGFMPGVFPGLTYRIPMGVRIFAVCVS